MTELRCDSKLHGILRDGAILEVKCGSRLCGHKPGVVVLHRFNARTGKLIETRKYKDPGVKERSKAHGSGNQHAALRTA